MKIGIVGAGTMGNGIAHVFALYGHSVQLCDVNKTIFLGKLNKYITGTGYQIQPIIVKGKIKQNFSINQDEVSSILHLPINYLLSNNIIKKAFYDKNKYFFYLLWRNNKIWGATAKILIDLINLLQVT